MLATAGCAKRSSPPTAPLTLQVARALKRVGLIWGSDIGLLGFDELEWAELAGVGITTLKQPTWQIGYAAVEQVIRRIAGTNDPIRERVFSGELIVPRINLPLTILRDADHKLNISPFLMEPIPSSVLRRLSNKRRE